MNALTRMFCCAADLPQYRSHAKGHGKRKPRHFGQEPLCLNHGDPEPLYASVIRGTSAYFNTSPTRSRERPLDELDKVVELLWFCECDVWSELTGVWSSFEYLHGLLRHSLHELHIRVVMVCTAGVTSQHLCHNCISSGCLQADRLVDTSGTLHACSYHA